MNTYRFAHAPLRFLTMALLMALVAPAALIGCNDETPETPGTNFVTNQNENQTETGNQTEVTYEAGVLDGHWSLIWDQDDEHFSDFHIEHNLDEGTLLVEFTTMTEEDQAGTMPNPSWQNEMFRGGWNPYPNDEMQERSVNYEITQSAFADDDDDVIRGRIMGTGEGFDFRDFTMRRNNDD